MRMNALAIILVLSFLATAISPAEALWWNNSFPYRYQILENKLTDNPPISVNDNSGVNGNIIWALTHNDSYVYSTLNAMGGSIAIANQTDENYWENETTRAGYSPTSIWGSDAVGIWHFGEQTGTTIHDSSTGGHDGTTAISPTWNSTGKFGYTINFDGATQYVDVGANVNLVNNFTISAWIYTTQDSSSYPNYQEIFNKDSGGQRGYELVLVGNKLKTTLCEDTSCSVYWYASGDTTINLNTWYHVAVVHNSATADTKLYVNGHEETLSSGGSNIYHVASNTAHATIGAVSGGSIYWFNGAIDEVQVYNETKSLDWIQKSYYNGINNLTSLGTVENLVGASIQITEPQNKTYYGISNFNYQFKGISGSASTFLLKAYDNGVNFYSNSSYSNNTIVSVSNPLSYGSHNLLINLDDGTSNITQNVIFYNYHGVNITLYDIYLGNVIPSNNFYLNSTNATNSMIFNNTLTPYTIEWNSLAQGNGYIDAENMLNSSNLLSYGNMTQKINVNSSMGFQNLSYYLYRSQNYRLQDADTLSYLTNYQIEFSNSTYSIIISDVNGYVRTSFPNLPFGVSTLKVSKTGYNETTFTRTFNLSSQDFETLQEKQAGVIINCFDEQTHNPLYFNIILSNGTYTISQNNINSYSVIYSDSIPHGFTKISITNISYIIGSVEYNYPQRNYYMDITNLSYLSLNAYLLRIDKGIQYTIYVTDMTGVPINSSLVTLSKNFNNTYLPIEQEVTDSSGSSVFFLDSTSSYQVKIEKSGYVNMLFYLSPNPIYRTTQARLTRTGQDGALLTNFTTMFDSISFRLSPDYFVSNSTIPFVYTISDSKAGLEYEGMRIYYRNVTGNETLLYNNTVYASPSGATFTYTSSNSTGWYRMVAFFKKAGYTEYSIERKYFIELPSGFGLFNPSQSFIDATGLSSFTLLFIAILITALVTGFFCRYSLGGGIAIGLIVLGIFTGIHFVDWLVFTVTFLTIVSILFIKSFW